MGLNPKKVFYPCLLVDNKNSLIRKMKMARNSNKAAVKKVVRNKRDKYVFKIKEPSGWELSKKKLDRVNKRGLQMSEGEGRRWGVPTYFGTEGDRRCDAVTVDTDVVVSVGTEGSNEVGGIAVKVRVLGDGVEKVLVD